MIPLNRKPLQQKNDERATNSTLELTLACCVRNRGSQHAKHIVQDITFRAFFGKHKHLYQIHSFW